MNAVPLVSFVPVIVQACFAFGSLLKLRAVYVAGTATEQSIAGSAFGVLGHVVMGVWAYSYAGEPGLVAASVIGVLTTLPLFSLIVYRRWRE